MYWRIVIVVALSASLLAVVLACNPSSSPPAPSVTPTPEPSATLALTPTAERTPSPTTTPPTPTPDEPFSLASGELEFGDPVPVPEDVAVIVETGCWGCDGIPQGLVRVYRDPSGEVRSDVLFHPDRLGLPPRVFTHGDGTSEGPPPATGFALAADGSNMAATLCTRGDCVTLGGPASADAQTALFRSWDGGVTWQEVARLDGGYMARSLLDDEIVLYRSAAVDEPPRATRYELFPSGRMLEPPLEGAWSPVAGLDGSLVWQTEGGFIDGKGHPLFDLSLGLGREWSVGSPWSAYSHEPSGRTTVTVSARSTGESGQTPGVTYHVAAFDSAGALLSSLSTGDTLVGTGPWLTADTVVGHAEIRQGVDLGLDAGYGLVPAIINLSGGTLNPMPSPFYDDSFPLRNVLNLVSAVQVGPFARVAGTSSCLRVREAPGLAAKVLDCAADGVLLYDRGETQVVAGVTWVAVGTPAGVEGWSSAEYLER